MKKWVYVTVLMIAHGICPAVTEKEEATAAIIRGNTEFAFDLYAKLKDKPGNLFFSPYSISTALALAYAGADGNTKEQMAATLHYDPSISDNRFHKLFGQLAKTFNQQGQKGGCQLSIANALWLQKDFQFQSAYLKLMESNYDAAFETVDFEKNAEPVRQKINQWVEDKTNRKIQELFKKDSLSEQSRLVLTNAVYFKGNWTLPFSKDNTKDTPFYINKSDTIDIPMMYQKEHFKYADCGMVSLLELPYEGKSLRMIILLSKDIDGIGQLEKQLNPDQLGRWQKELSSQEVMVYLPQFKTTCEFALADTLKKMGMTDAFTDAADFSGMAKYEGLFISSVVHKAFVEVNEEGTEAAAATGVVVGLTGMPAPSPMFCADHPFIFMIQDNTTNSILFIGRVADPTQTGQ
jgi:serine protease inhibitor